MSFEPDTFPLQTEQSNHFTVRLSCFTLMTTLHYFKYSAKKFDN